MAQIDMASPVGTNPEARTKSTLTPEVASISDVCGCAIAARAAVVITARTTESGKGRWSSLAGPSEADIELVSIYRMGHLSWRL